MKKYILLFLFIGCNLHAQKLTDVTYFLGEEVLKGKTVKTNKKINQVLLFYLHGWA